MVTIDSGEVNSMNNEEVIQILENLLEQVNATLRAAGIETEEVK